jgi:pSer/pThr/pTyr-binding forkhead associated (FHA) protein
MDRQSPQPGQHTEHRSLSIKPVMWKLFIEDDDGQRTVLSLTRDDYTIGRRQGSAIRLTERNVSRDHARISRQKAPDDRSNGTIFVLEDLKSSNGVFVNGLRVAESQTLEHGDLIQIGDYRIVLSDDERAALEAKTTDVDRTAPIVPRARAAALMDRPNRFVMIQGPTPGTEFPLDRDRLTIGRNEDASLFVNDSSVSRLHCEVHALGDGRFEIVDMGSSNGVQVNGAELRRGIVEPGDVIDLGDVRFKFVGAGQIFRPDLLTSRKSARPQGMSQFWNRSNALPVGVFLAIALSGIAAAWALTRGGR